MRSHPSITHRYLHNLIPQSSTSTIHSKPLQRPLSLANDRTPVQTIHNAFPTTPSRTSTVHIGTTYEHLCAHTLPLLGFTNLTRTGGRSDLGIDLLGSWILPSPSPSSGHLLRAIIQCKAHARKPGPEMIRELEGAVAGAPSEWRSEDTIGVLCAKREATEGVRRAVKRSRRGLVWVMIEGGGEGRVGRVRQVLWNERVGKAVGERVGAGVRYVSGERGMEKEVCLMVDGEVWEPDGGREVS